MATSEGIPSSIDIEFLELNDNPYVNMKNYGCEVSANSAKPPIFADEYLVSETERIFEVTIKEPIIITVDVELPRAEKTI